ncbi:hypothetical protein CTEN210_14244 [Chaetoceros tenuissimus]|uniref:Uncharacterized protein n=1 Tax=Chaetoceros tenuissimus TaxID=426638 RepID=A0AAD3HC70_9STRA|nr:hypothetical protein CTEN210_14244 [Chaetoceros tenuissimus]
MFTFFSPHFVFILFLGQRLLNIGSNTRLSLTTVNSHGSNGASTDIHSDLKLSNKFLKWAIQKEAVILIDVENVRGKTQFKMSHRELLKRVVLYTQLYNLEQNQVSMIIDHGSDQCEYYLPENLGNVTLNFAGPLMKADDVLARDVSKYDRNVALITSDVGLKARCQSTMNRANSHKIEFLEPRQFVKDLNLLYDRVEKEKSKLEKEAKSGKKKYMSKRDEMKESKLLWKHLALKYGDKELDGISVLKRAVDFDKLFLCKEVTEWEREREQNKKRSWEKTNDRIFVAEQFRRQVEQFINKQ